MSVLRQINFVSFILESWLSPEVTSCFQACIIENDVPRKAASGKRKGVYLSAWLPQLEFNLHYLLIESFEASFAGSAPGSKASVSSPSVA